MSQVIFSPIEIDKPGRAVAVELLPTFLARPQALRAHENYTLAPDRESIIDELADLFKG